MNILLFLVILVILIFFLYYLDNQCNRVKERFNLVPRGIVQAPGFPFNEWRKDNFTHRWRKVWIKRGWFRRRVWRYGYDPHWVWRCYKNYVPGLTDPDIYKSRCNYVYEKKKDQLKSKPCTKENEFSRYCDFYSKNKFDYNTRAWIPIDRNQIKNGEQSHCEQQPELFKVCCHSCSL